LSRPRLLDLYCGAGGIADGYVRAGFVVVGVDHEPQPNYPYTFCHADALDILRGIIDHPEETRDQLGIVAVHASPPCQLFTAYKRHGRVWSGWLDLIGPTRELLDLTGLPYVIENVPASPLKDPVMLCGSMFDPPLEVRRHRCFEANWPLLPPAWPCRHDLLERGAWPAATNRQEGSRRTAEIGVWRIPLDAQLAAMGIDRPMTRHEVSQAIPPVYGELIGEQLIEWLGRL
jgi:DNA (cytosine-5)-methyltransferase 1